MIRIFNMVNQCIYCFLLVQFLKQQQLIYNIIEQKSTNDMQSSIRFPSYSIRDELDNEFSELMKERSQIEGPGERYKKKSKTTNIGYGVNNQGSVSQLHQNDIAAIQQIQRNVISKIQAERADNQEIKARILDLQIKSEQERKKSAFLQAQLQRLTGINYSRQNNKGIAQRISNQPIFQQPYLTPKVSNHQTGYQINYPINNLPNDLSHRPFSPNQQQHLNISEINMEINKLAKQNQELKRAKGSKNQGLISQLKSRIILAEQKAQQYKNAMNSYREKAKAKFQTTAYNPEIASLLADAQKIKNQGQRLISEKQNLERNDSKKYEKIPTQKSRLEETGINKSYKYVQTIPQERSEYRYERLERAEPKYHQKKGFQQPKLTQKVEFPSKLQIKSVISSTQEIKKPDSQNKTLKDVGKKPSINQNKNLGSPNHKVTESKKNIQSMLDQMMKVFSGSE